jgi:hypothetical protein
MTDKQVGAPGTEDFWAADIGKSWVKMASRDAALSESAQYLRRPHAMRMKRMKLSELIRERASTICCPERIAEELSEGDADIEWYFNHEANPLGESIDDDDLDAIVGAGVLAMMAEADRRGLVCDGCWLLEEVYGEIEFAGS